MKRAGIVGYGAIGPIHARVFENNENIDAKLVAVCDTDRLRADTASEKHDVKAFYDYDEMLHSGMIDSVHICTPHYLHKDMAVKALMLGLDVVLEKPVAINITEFEQLLSVKRKSSGRVCVMFQNRTNRCIEQLIRLISDKEASGRLKTVNAHMTWQRDEKYYRSGEWRGKWATEGGGLLINQAVHLIDLMGYLNGGISAVSGTIANRSLNGVIEVEDTADAVFEFKNGLRGCFYATNASACSIPVQLEVLCEKALYRYADNTLYKITDGSFDGVICTDAAVSSGKLVWGSGHKSVISSFYNGGKYTSLEEAENSTRALFAFYESAKRGGASIVVD